MIAEYIQAALERAQNKVIDNSKPVFLREVPELEGVWATGYIVEECRRELISVIEGWIALRLSMGDSIPPIGSFTINVSMDRGLLSKIVPVSRNELIKGSRSWDSQLPLLMAGVLEDELGHESLFGKA